MPLFKCANCGCVENTALCNYWTRNLDWTNGGKQTLTNPALCSACDPAIAQWHGRFPRRPWDADAERHSGMPPGL